MGIELWRMNSPSNSEEAAAAAEWLYPERLRVLLIVSRGIHPCALKCGELMLRIELWRMNSPSNSEKPPQRLNGCIPSACGCFSLLAAGFIPRKKKKKET
ncbi:MAG: hypothetical protein R2867_45490 [Caldilineaceae bacterium]